MQQASLHEITSFSCTHKGAEIGTPATCVTMKMAAVMILIQKCLMGSKEAGLVLCNSERGPTPQNYLKLFCGK